MSDFSFVHENHGQDLLRAFNESRKTRTFCDVVLKVNPRHQGFPAHRQVLAAISPYFKTLYEASSHATNGDIFSLQETILQDLSDTVLEIILDFMYTGAATITTENARDIFKASTLLQLESLKKACTGYMKKGITPENSLQCILIGAGHQCRELSQKARENVAANFTNIVGTHEFSSLEAKDLKAIISSDSLMVASENEVYLAVKKWIEHDLGQRMRYVPLLMSNIRFRFLPREFLKKSCAQEPIMITSPLAQDFVHEALVYETLPREEQENVHTSRVKARWCTQSLDVISLVGGVSLGNHSSATGHWAFDPVSNQWYTACPLLSPRYHFGLVQRDGKLYVFGGSMREGCDQLVATVEVYDPKLNQWKSITKTMKEARSRFDAVTVGEIVYFVGGMCSDPHRNTLEICHLFLTEESPRKELCLGQLSVPKQPRYDHCTAVLDGKIYFIGGCTRGHSALQTVECYNPDSNTWDDVAPLLVPRSGACAVVLDNCVVVIGGSNKKNPLNSCEIYDLKKEQWEYISPMNERRDRCSAALFKEKIYVFGGSYGQVTHNSVECYTAKANKWKVVTHLPDSKHGFRCAASVVNRSLAGKICFEQV